MTKISSQSRRRKEKEMAKRKVFRRSDEWPIQLIYFKVPGNMNNGEFEANIHPKSQIKHLKWVKCARELRQHFNSRF